MDINSTGAERKEKVIRVVYLSLSLRLKAKCNHWQQPFSDKQKTSEAKKTAASWIIQKKNGKQIKNRAKMSNKRCIKARLQYLQRGHKASEATSLVLLYFIGFPGWLAWFSLQIFCLNSIIQFSLANANYSASFKRKMVSKWRFLLIHKQQTNLWMKLPTIPPG